jgi:hypothetical protein
VRTGTKSALNEAEKARVAAGIGLDTQWPKSLYPPATFVNVHELAHVMAMFRE